jgi:hypothetical protein
MTVTSVLAAEANECITTNNNRTIRIALIVDTTQILSSNFQIELYFNHECDMNM